MSQDNNNGWDMSDFLQRYTVKSNTQSSPVALEKNPTNDLFNLSNDATYKSSPDKQQEEFHQHDDVFCTKENIEKRIQYLNQELTMLGYDAILSDKFPTQTNNNNIVCPNLDITKLVNCTYELLRRQHSHAKNNEDLEERHIRSENDNEYLLQNQARLKQDLENVKREAALLLCREKDQIERGRIFQQDLKNEREEKRKMKSDVEHLKKQFYHESKRKEKELVRLKDKIHQTLNDKLERKMGFDVLNALQRTDGKRSMWKTGGKKNEEEMFKLVLSNFEEKEKVITHENQCLREVLTDIQTELVTLDTSAEDIEEDIKRLQMPFHIVKQDVETRIKGLLLSLKQRIEVNTPLKQESPPLTDDDSFTVKQQNEELANKLEQCKQVIAGQEKILQHLKDGYSKGAVESVLMNLENNDETSLEHSMSRVNDETKKLQEERKQFQDYVLKIAKEKEDFERERVEFYMHCISTPVINKEKSRKYKDHVDGKHKNSRMVTPSFSPARKPSKTKTPSTVELYKFMSLNYDSGISRASDRLSSLDGSYTHHDYPSSNTSPTSLKLQEHVDNVRRAVEERHNKTVDSGE